MFKTRKVQFLNFLKRAYFQLGFIKQKFGTRKMFLSLENVRQAFVVNWMFKIREVQFLNFLQRAYLQMGFIFWNVKMFLYLKNVLHAEYIMQLTPSTQLLKFSLSNWIRKIDILKSKCYKAFINGDMTKYDNIKTP